MSRFDFSDVYMGLKDFQRNTVEYAFQRMYLDRPAARRFLVADEVGLGKTLVARGLIARAIEHLDAQGVRRIDVVYICSNSAIARQNISRLNVTKQEEFTFASRITLLASQLKQLAKNRLNFVSFTPGTSFDLKSNLGLQEERMLLYWLLRQAWDFGGTKGPKRAFQGGVSSFTEWERRLTAFRKNASIDRSVLDGFLAALSRHEATNGSPTHSSLRERFDVLAAEWAHDRSHRTWEETHRRSAFVGELRALLARATIEALEPDLVILDEFQRFKHLLSGESEAAQLAHSMFDYSNDHSEARVLLLSATPYKMYTLSDESADDDHYEDFTRTVDFLLNGDGAGFRTELEDMRRALVNVAGTGAEPLLLSKTKVETRLRSVMARTERLSVTEDRGGMLVHADGTSPVLTARDLLEFVAVDRVAHKLDAQSPLEYWKSTAYFPNFWNDYEIGRRYQKAQETDHNKASELRALLQESPGLISWAEFRRFGALDPGNARMRHLWSSTLDQDIWKLLWLPPALPYYELGGPFTSQAARGFTKRLIFSGWNVVPKSVSTLTSYEAERRMMRLHRSRGLENTPEAREKIPELLRFPNKKLTGMSALAVIYPSPSLARLADPLAIGATLRAEGTSPTPESVLERAGSEIWRKLRHHLPTDGPIDERWYWAAALVLDRDIPGQNEWMRKQARGAFLGDQRVGDGFQAHLDLANQIDRNRIDPPLGRPPHDLAEVLALVAMGGPGNIALRSLGRVSPRRRSPYSDFAMRAQAARLAWAFRSLFNTPEVSYLIQGLVRTGPYWQKVLRYAVDGCLQAVLDEYIHIAGPWHGLLEVTEEYDLWAVVDPLADIVSLRAADLHAQDPLDPEADHRIRCRFALPFGRYRSEDDQQLQREGSVRAAFNSPFWPFVLTTTSIGQEGLDFHQYCHAVVHWNLPANPVDLEQREGRVHRYLGHAVRKNIAAKYGTLDFSQTKNPWETMIEAAVADRVSGLSDLVPYWVFEGEAKIERHVPSLPLSREEGRLDDLRRSLALYRVVFGQPRQEELVAWLQTTATPELIDALRVDLTPRSAAGPLGRFA